LRCLGSARADLGRITGTAGVRPLPLKSARRAGSVAPGRLDNPWFPASRRAHSARGDALNFPARARFAFAQRMSRKRPQVWPHPFNSAGLGRPFANTRRTPSRAFGGSARSARLGPSRRRRGSRRCGTQTASAHRRCNPALRGERRLRPSAAGAPARHRGSAQSAGGPSASYRASRPRRCRGNGSRRCMRHTEPAPHLRAPRPPGSPAECGPLSACPRPSLSVSSHHEHLGSRANLGVLGRILLPQSVTCPVGWIPSAARPARPRAPRRAWR